MGIKNNKALTFCLVKTTPLTYIVDMFTFIETSIFERILPHYLNDKEYAELQEFLMENPEAGDIVKGSGGIRKLRWKRSGTGKSSGVRVIYFVRYSPAEIWLLTLYAKSVKSAIPGHILRKLKEEISHE